MHPNPHQEIVRFILTSPNQTRTLQELLEHKTDNDLHFGAGVSIFDVLESAEMYFVDFCMISGQASISDVSQVPKNLR